MKTNVKNLIQQVTEELKNKHTQRIMVWSLLAAVCFLILIGILSSLGGQDSKNNEDETSEAKTSSQVQEDEVQSGEEDGETALEDEMFYVNFSEAGTVLSLATINGLVQDEPVEVYVSYNKEEHDVFMYYYSEVSQVAEIVLNYSIELVEGNAYEISVEDNNGVICLKQNDMVLCSASVVPNGICQWTQISTHDTGIVDGTEEVPSGSMEDGTTEEESTTDILETNENETPEETMESSSDSVTVKDGKVNYKALFGDIVIAAFVALILSMVVIFIMIAATRKTNPFGIVMATVRAEYPNMKDRRQWKHNKDEYEEDEDEYEDEEDDDMYDDDEEYDDTYDEEEYDDDDMSDNEEEE